MAKTLDLVRDSASLIFVAVLLVACSDDRAPAEAAVAAPATEPVKSTCSKGSFLRASLSGALTADVDWPDAALRCESMRRPDDRGVRLRLSGEVRGERLAFIIALPDLGAGETGTGFDSVVTITVEGSARFFSTPSLGACWADIEINRPLAEPGGSHVVAGTLDCVGPLGEFNGEAYVDLRDLQFSGVGDWNAT
jgi:hypothetical protein